MKLDAGEQMRGKKWFWLAGLTALCLTVFLAVADLALTFSTRRDEVGAVLGELRHAATSLRTGSPDERNRRVFADEAPERPGAAVEQSSGHREDHPSGSH